MVSGHLQVKKGFYYVVLSYYNNNGKRRVKYFSTGLPEKGNKRKAEAELARIRSEFVPPTSCGGINSLLIRTSSASAFRLQTICLNGWKSSRCVLRQPH